MEGEVAALQRGVAGLAVDAGRRAEDLEGWQTEFESAWRDATGGVREDTRQQVERLEGRMEAEILGLKMNFGVTSGSK